jgi:hypothetical protein
MTTFTSEDAADLKELIVSTLAMTDALTKILIEKGLISETEFKEQLRKERALYQDLLKTES